MTHWRVVPTELLREAVEVTIECRVDSDEELRWNRGIRKTFAVNHLLSYSTLESSLMRCET